MFLLNDKRINPHAAHTTAEGVTYANLLDPAVRSLLGVVEVAEPTPPEDYSDETYFKTEQDDAPYVVFTKKPDEMIEQVRRAKLQAQIDALDGGNPMARPTREFMILSMEKEAVAAGFTVEELRASHYAYRKVKELDEQIVALRGQL